MPNVMLGKVFRIEVPCEVQGVSILFLMEEKGLLRPDAATGCINEFFNFTAFDVHESVKGES